MEKDYLRKRTYISHSFTKQFQINLDGQDFCVSLFGWSDEWLHPSDHGMVIHKCEVPEPRITKYKIKNWWNEKTRGTIYLCEDEASSSSSLKTATKVHTEGLVEVWKLSDERMFVNHPTHIENWREMILK